MNTILGYHYRASTQLRTQSFDIRLKNEPRVGTPIRHNLIGTHDKQWPSTSLPQPDMLVRSDHCRLNFFGGIRRPSFYIQHFAFYIHLCVEYCNLKLTLNYSANHT